MSGQIRLAFIATLLTFVVVTLGAYVRLSDAGLGCPDWPGCYGHPTPAHAAHEIARAEADAPHGVVSSAKAWKEMVHRYAASTLGVVILMLALWGWRDHIARRRAPPALETLLLALVIFQGLLGMWTVTLLLKPVIVSAHLLGGMTLFSLLCWLVWRNAAAPAGLRHQHPLPRPWLRLALLLLVVQIALGAWVSSNYAALACTDFPTCHGAWWPDMDFTNAYSWQRQLGETMDGQLLSMESLTAIHFSHRLGAVLTAGLLAITGFKLLRRGHPVAGYGLLGLLVLQIGLGIANILASLPLAVAVAHNGVAALLLALLVSLNLAANQRRYRR